VMREFGGVLGEGLKRILYCGSEGGCGNMVGMVGNAALGLRGEWNSGRQSAGAGSVILELYFGCPKDSSKGVGNVLFVPFPYTNEI